MHTIRAAALAARLGRPAAALTALTLAGLGLTATAQAQTTKFSDRTSFMAASSGLTTFTFDGGAPKYYDTQYAAGMTVSGVGFANGTGDLYAIDPNSPFGDPFGGHQYLYAYGPTTLTITLPAGTTAFGADFSNFYSTSAAMLTATVNGTAFTFSAPGSYGSAAGSSFAGFTSSVPITSLTLSGGTYGPAAGNVSFGKAGAPAPAGVPEPSAPVSLGVGVLGLAGLAAARRRKLALPAL